MNPVDKELHIPALLLELQAHQKMGHATQSWDDKEKRTIGWEDLVTGERYFIPMTFLQGREGFGPKQGQKFEDETGIPMDRFCDLIRTPEGRKKLFGWSPSDEAE